MNSTAKLRNFIVSLAQLVEKSPDEEAIFKQVGSLLKDLITTDDWLPAAYAVAHPEHYQQHLLYADPLNRFSVVSFVWGPGQRTPIHDHTVWGLIGVLRGAEISQSFLLTGEGRLEKEGLPATLLPGTIEHVSPRTGDLHQVSNGAEGQVSVSIHVYGANIGAVRRKVYKENGEQKLFISGYSNTSLPNLWDLSKEN